MTITVTIMKYTARQPIEWVSLASGIFTDEENALYYVNEMAQKWVNEGRAAARKNQGMFELCAMTNRFFHYAHGKVSFDCLGGANDMAANQGQEQWMAVLDEESQKRFYEAHKDKHCTCDGDGHAGCELHDPAVVKLVA